MAHLIVVCERQAPDARRAADELRRCAAMLSPDNIRPNPCEVRERHGVLTAVVNPVAGIPTHDGAVCLGRFFGDAGDWWQPGSQAPDGSFVVVRSDAGRLELLSDILATRPLWYVHNERRFLASTSQRALVMLLGTFEFNHEALTWMLACGHLGSRSWDARLQRLPGDARLVLDRHSWEMRIERRPALRDPLALSAAQHTERFAEAILQTCASLDLPGKEWLLPLSGGLDSRMLLLGMVRAGQRPHCVTWGLQSSLLDANNDACVARELAAAVGVDQRYYLTDGMTDSFAAAFERFLVAGEGQVADFAGYTDGMAMWKVFFESGISGVIRGDEPGIGYFARYDVELQERRRLRQVFVSDYPPGHPIRDLGLAEQHWNDSLSRRPRESLAAFDARLYEDVYFPAKLAPLNTLKTAYVEIVNPLQARAVVEVARRLPDDLRIRRKPLRDIVHSLGPDVPLANKPAIAVTDVFLRTDSAVGAMAEALSATGAERVLARPALETVLTGLLQKPADQSARHRVKSVVKSFVPKGFVDRVRPVWPLPPLGGRRLAYRTYIAVGMAEMLARDAGALGKGAGHGSGPGADP